MKYLTLFIIVFLSLSLRIEAVVALNAPTTGNFVEVGLGGASDNVVDNQANRPDLELVGDGANLGAFYVAFDYGAPARSSATDGTMGFRIRVAGENGNSDGVLGGNVYIGFDLTGDGALDYMLEHGGSGPTQAISLLRMGPGVNRPTAVEQGQVATYDVGGSAVPASVNVSEQNSLFATVKLIDDAGSAFNDGNYADYDLDGGFEGKAPKTADDSAFDRFLTFTFDFAIFAEVVRQDYADDGYLEFFDDSYTFSMLVVTSQNANNINSDFGGIDGKADDYNPNIPFAQQPDGNGGTGAGLSPFVVIDGSLVPEPATYALLFGLLTLAFTGVRRRR